MSALRSMRKSIKILLPAIAKAFQYFRFFPQKSLDEDPDLIYCFSNS